MCEFGLEFYEHGTIPGDEIALYGAEFFMRAGNCVAETFSVVQPIKPQDNGNTDDDEIEPNRKPSPADYALRDRFEDEWHETMPDFAKCKKCNEWAFEFKCPKDNSHKVGCARCLQYKNYSNIAAFICPECKSPIKVPDDKSDDSDAEPSYEDKAEMRRVERIFAGVYQPNRPKITFGKCEICMNGKNTTLISCPVGNHLHNIGCLKCTKKWFNQNKREFSIEKKDTCQSCAMVVIDIAKILRRQR
jgi:hypothetical protein